MTWVKVLKDHVFQGQRGPEARRAGDTFDILTKQEFSKCLAEGIIERLEDTSKKYGKTNLNAKPYTKTVRFGIWIKTTSFYSGGRLHMFQYMWCLAGLENVEVFFISDKRPRWLDDYPTRNNIQFTDASKIPNDLDCLITDSKTEIGMQCIKYKEQHPQCKLFIMNFETPNWVKEFCTEYGTSLENSVHKSTFKIADYWLANSNQSLIYLARWMKGEKTKVQKSFVLQPAINNFAAFHKEKIKELEGRNFVLWSSRSASHKKKDFVIKFITEYKDQMDLVLVGDGASDGVEGTEKNKIHKFKGISDKQKYNLMSQANAVLAPSLFEGYGMVPQEAISVGTPVVAFDLPVLQEEYAEEIKAGMLLLAKWNDYEDFKKLANKAVKLKKTKRTREKVALNLLQKNDLNAMQNKVVKLPFHDVSKSKVFAHMVCYWGFYEESIESVYDHIEKLVVAFGPTKEALKLGKIDDGSYDRLMSWIDKHDKKNKIKVILRDSWENKLEMRSTACSYFIGNYMLKLDADEIWVGVEDWIKNVNFGTPRWVNFWHNEKHWIYDKHSGNRWGEKLQGIGSSCPHYRLSFWRPTYRFRTHSMPEDASGNALKIVGTSEARKNPNTVIYHLGHMLNTEVMNKKHDFYLERDGKDKARLQRKEAWHSWNGKNGECSDGVVLPVDWELPEIVKKAITRKV